MFVSNQTPRNRPACPLARMYGASCFVQCLVNVHLVKKLYKHVVGFIFPFLLVPQNVAAPFPPPPPPAMSLPLPPPPPLPAGAALAAELTSDLTALVSTTTALSQRISALTAAATAPFGAADAARLNLPKDQQLRHVVVRWNRSLHHS